MAQGDTTAMTVSVIICAFTPDRWDALTAAVVSCQSQTVKPAEVLVVIDHNPALLHRVRQEIEGVVALPNEFAQGLSGARNTGVLHSTGDILAFLDDDAAAEAHWLEHLVGSLSDPTVAGAGGWITPSFESGTPTWFPETFYWVFGCSYPGLPATGERIRNPIGTNMVLRRKIFTSVGSFTSGLGRIGRRPLGCEETELCIRYTNRFPEERFVMCREAVVHHSVPASRTTLRYFGTRCWAEGISKAAVSSLVGGGPGLSSERAHVRHSLPLELRDNLRMLRRRPGAALARSILIAVGTVCAVAGLVRGQLQFTRRPLEVGDDFARCPGMVATGEASPSSVDTGPE